MKNLVLILVLTFTLSHIDSFAQLKVEQIEEAEKLYNEGDYKSVIKILRPAAELDEINTQAEMLVADSYHKKEEFVDAIEHYNRAEEGGLESFELYFHRARAYISIEEYKKGSKDMDKAIALQPENAQLYFFRAYAQSELNHLQNALKDYNSAVQYDSTFTEAYYNRASTKMELEDYEGLMEDVAKAKELGLDSEYIDFTTAQYTYEQKEYEKAIPLFQALLDNTDDKATKGMANYYIAECYYYLKDSETACQYFYKAAKLGDIDAEETFENFCEKDQLRTLFKPRKKLEKVSF